MRPKLPRDLFSRREVHPSPQPNLPDEPDPENDKATKRRVGARSTACIYWWVNCGTSGPTTSDTFCRTSWLLTKQVDDSGATFDNWHPADFVFSIRSYTKRWLNRCPDDDIPFVCETLIDLVRMIQLKASDKRKEIC